CGIDGNQQECAESPRGGVNGGLVAFGRGTKAHQRCAARTAGDQASVSSGEHQTGNLQYRERGYYQPTPRGLESIYRPAEVALGHLQICPTGRSAGEPPRLFNDQRKNDNTVQTQG